MKSPLVPTQERRHVYQWASATEKKSVFNELLQDRQRNQLQYKKRFVNGANPIRPAYLRFSPADFHSDDSLQMNRAFHQGLLKDEHGTYWIVKRSTLNGNGGLERQAPRNSPRYERLAYLLARTRANYAEIRLLRGDELRLEGEALLSDVKNCYVTRVMTASNVSSSSLPQTAFADAFAAIFVANIFMRKWDQHLKNFAYVGETPVAIDHDMIGPPTTFPHTTPGLSIFNLAFLSFKLVTTLSFLKPEHPVDSQARLRLKYHFLRENHREAWGIMQDMINGLGLGGGLIQAEGLHAGVLRSSIQAFKETAGIEASAHEAGFQGRERELIVRYLQQSQRNLGRDVGVVWHRLSSQNARFQDLD